MEQIVDLWRMVWRRFWIIALVLVLGLPLVALYAYLKLPLYEAEAKILVESQRIPGDMARTTVTIGAGERLQQIQQRLMARDNLLNLIREVGLYADRDDLTLTEKVDLAREATKIVPITLTGVRAHGHNTVLSAFIIRVTYESPEKAAELANRFVTVVLDQNIQSRSERARETTAFFAQEQERLDREIIALEAEITRFKQENKDALPDSVLFRQSELSRLGDARLALSQRLLDFEEERRQVLVKLDALSRTGTTTGQPGPGQVELARLEAALVRTRAIKAETHPEIRALERQIAALKAVLAGTAAPAETAGPRPTSAEEVELRGRLDTLVSQAKLLTAEKETLEKRRADLAESLQKTPAIEIQLNALARRLTEKQEMHGVITRKRTEAETGERMEVNQQAERFEVIESAIVPQKPIAPNRRKIVVLGSGVVFVLAFGLALLADQMRPRIRSGGQLERQLGLRPVVSLPYVRTRSERRQRLAWRGSIAALVLLGIPAGLYAVDRFYRPLPLVAEQLAEKSGADNIIRMIEKRF